MLFWKELKVYTLDPVFSKNLGFETNALELMLIVLLVIGIVVGIQSIGVILMIAMLITPPAAARQWVSSLKAMVFVAAAIGALSSITGCVISALVKNVSTGPVIILVCIAIFVVSLLFAPHRGVKNDLFARRNWLATGRTRR